MLISYNMMTWTTFFSLLLCLCDGNLVICYKYMQLITDSRAIIFKTWPNCWTFDSRSKCDCYVMIFTCCLCVQVHIIDNLAEFKCHSNKTTVTSCSLSQFVLSLVTLIRYISVNRWQYMLLNSLKKSVISAFYSIKPVSSLESPRKCDSCLASFCVVFSMPQMWFLYGSCCWDRDKSWCL